MGAAAGAAMGAAAGAAGIAKILASAGGRSNEVVEATCGFSAAITGFSILTSQLGNECINGFSQGRYIVCESLYILE
jgi:hypothetical protein